MESLLYQGKPILPPNTEVINQAIDLLVGSLRKRNALDDWSEAHTEGTLSQIGQAIGLLGLAWKFFEQKMVLRERELRKRINGLSPFHNKLPVELQIKIMRQFIQDGVEANRNHFALLHLLAKVSTRWCALVKGTPELWAYVDLLQSVKTTVTTLRLSGNVPLHIKGKDLTGNRGDDLSRRLHLVGADVRRWRTFGFGSCDATVIPPLQCFLHFANTLTELDLEFNLRPQTQDAGLVLDLGKNPSLVRLKCKNTPLSIRSIPTTNLRSLSLSFPQSEAPSIRNLLHLFKSCHLLEDMELIGRPGDFVPSEISRQRPSGSVEMQRLQSVRVAGVPSSFALDLLSSINVARLRFLEVDPFGAVWGAEALRLLTDPAESPLLSTPDFLSTDTSYITIQYYPDRFGLFVRLKTEAGEELPRGFALGFWNVTWPQLVDSMSKLHDNFKLPMRLRLEETSVVDLLRIGELVGLEELEIPYDEHTGNILQHLSSRQVGYNGELGWPCPGLAKISLRGPPNGAHIEWLRGLSNTLMNIRAVAAKARVDGEVGEGSQDSHSPVKAVVVTHPEPRGKLFGPRR